LHTATFDIETTSLEAVGAGILIAAVIKPVGKKEIVFRTDHYKDPLGKEEALLTAVLHHLAQYDLLVGHNIDKFDLPWLRSRAVQLGVEGGESFAPFTYDTCKAFRRVGYLTVRNAIGKPTASLAHAVDFFRLPQYKTAIYPNEWWETVWGDRVQRRAAIDKVVDHCVRDVRNNAMIYPLLLRVDRRAKIGRLL
jgi:uncharacterized protein YprB with RNaseH-like and TPR domain